MYKILIVVPFEGAVQYHRQLIPHHNLGDNYPEFHISQINEVDSVGDDFLKQFHLIQFSRTFSWKKEPDSCRLISERLKRLGIISVFDVDDYWRYPSTHLLYHQHKEDMVTQKSEECLRAADCVTTTTEYFAGVCREFNSNVIVLPNAIDPNQPQFISRPTEGKFIRFGWIGGECHLDDLMIMRDCFSNLYKDYSIKGKYQLIHAGFQDGDLKMVRILYERIFTNDYKSLSHIPDYVNYLKKYSQIGADFCEDMPYKRFWGTDVYNYGFMYNDIDVSLVPLNVNKFNRCKSQLKIIEAGFMKKAVIASDVMPYTIDCIHEKNALMVNPFRNKTDWKKNIRRLILEPNLREDIANALYETVKDKYNINTVNKIRADLYKHLIEKNLKKAA